MDTNGYFTWLTVHWPNIVYTALGIALTVGLCMLIRKLHSRRILLNRKMVWLELTPPSHTSKSSLATKELFNIIHGFYGSRSIRERLLGRTVAMSFEIASSRHGGIRYLIHVEKRHTEGMKQTIIAYLPSIKVAEITPEEEDENYQIIEFKQSGHYAFPLAKTESFEANDPVSYLANAMANLEPSEHMRLQVVVSPVRINEALLLARRILGNEDMLRRLNSRKLPL